ncbi:MAG: Hsp20/alpha crystallin family protein [Burkholderiaceae bacterium]|jgi:HSP20 family molecular chaperone IbpA|nr:Hsp20/alpha crystallin family protein [Burkholderiaceae bacterium]
MFFTATTPVINRPAYAPALSSLDRFLNDTLSAARDSTTRFKDEDNQWELSIDVPGVSREQIGIAIEGPTVRVETIESAPRQYKKAYEFAQDVDAARSSAKLENGVLTLTLAKVLPQSKAATLAIA